MNKVAKICFACSAELEGGHKCVVCGGSFADTPAILCHDCAKDPISANECISCGSGGYHVAHVCGRCEFEYRNKCVKCGATLW